MDTGPRKAHEALTAVLDAMAGDMFPCGKAAQMRKLYAPPCRKETKNMVRFDGRVYDARHLIRVNLLRKPKTDNRRRICQFNPTICLVMSSNTMADICDHKNSRSIMNLRWSISDSWT